MAEGPLGSVRAWIVLATCALSAAATAQPDPCSRIRDAATAKTAYDAALAAALAPPGTRPGATVAEADAAATAAEVKVQTANLAVVSAEALLRAKQALLASLRRRGGRGESASPALVESELQTAQSALAKARVAAAAIRPSNRTAYENASLALVALESVARSSAPTVAIEVLGDPSRVAGIPDDALRGAELDRLRQSQKAALSLAQAADERSVEPGVTKLDKSNAVADAARHRATAATFVAPIAAAVASVRADVRRRAGELVAARNFKAAALAALGPAVDQAAAAAVVTHQATVTALEAELALAKAVVVEAAKVTAATVQKNAATLVLQTARRVAASARDFEEYDQRLAKVTTSKGVLAAREAEATAVRAQADGLMVAAEPRFDAIQTALTAEVARLRRLRDDGLRQKLAATKAKWDAEVQRLVASGNWSNTNQSSVTAEAKAEFKTVRQFAEGDFRMKRDQARAESARQLDAIATPLQAYSCLDSVKEFLQRVATRKSALENTSTALVVEDDRSAIPDPELTLPPVPEPKAPRIVINASFVESIVNGEAAKRMSATLKLTVDFGTGAVSGTFSGAGSGEIDAMCDTRLRYTYGHSGAVSGSVDAAGRLTIRIAPRGSSEARFVRAGTCKFKPGETGPWSGKGTITGTVSKTGAATLASKWQVRSIGVSGTWSGSGGVMP